MSVTDDEARQFAAAFRKFLDWVHRDSTDRHNEVVQLVRGHLGSEGLQQSVVGGDLAPFDQVNLQVALNAWIAEPGREVAVHGVTVPPHFGSVSLQMLLHGDGLPPIRLSAPGLVDLPSGPDRTVACWHRALLLIRDSRGEWLIFLRSPDPHEGVGLGLEVAGLPTPEAQQVLRELAALRLIHNVYRGQVLELAPTPSGISITFPRLPTTARDDVVLPASVLRRVERHAIEIGKRREELRQAGQHLKRGLLLYGPPGTGKTHTTRYVVQQMVGSTIFMLSGQSLYLIGAIMQLARDLQPAVIVLEDVDLVAEDRGHGPASSTVLFELLDAMDGSAPDADLLFLLTTNRADLLEPALAARPGRVDVAVEIGLPDAEARGRLFELYSRGVPLEIGPDDVAQVVERTEGVTASFVKELLRRAVLESLTESDGSFEHVTGAHLARALDDLLDSSQSVTRALLGVPADQRGPVESPPIGPGRHGHDGMGWVAARHFGTFGGHLDVSYGD